MFSSVSDIEKTPRDRDEGIVVFTVTISFGLNSLSSDSRFQETISVTVNDLNGLIVGYADVIRLNSNNFAKLLMNLVDSFVPPAMTNLPHKP